MKTARPALIIAFGAALDLAAKLWARTSLEPYGAATDFLPFVALRLTFNQGVSFSLFSFEGETARLVLLLATAALTASFALWAFRSQGLERIAASFIVAGALANVIDRAVYGVVTDYLDCQSARKSDPLSARNFDPLGGGDQGLSRRNWSVVEADQALIVMRGF